MEITETPSTLDLYYSVLPQFEKEKKKARKK